MSYLIGMYVYYHGNNLAMFGYVKGTTEDLEEPNRGLSRPEEVSTINVGIEAAQDMRQYLEKQQNTTNYEDMMRAAVLKSQQDSMRLRRANLSSTTVLDNTPEHILDDYESPSGDINMSFFDEMNGLNGFSNNNPFNDPFGSNGLF